MEKDKDKNEKQDDLNNTFISLLTGLSFSSRKSTNSSSNSTVLVSNQKNEPFNLDKMHFLLTILKALSESNKSNLINCHKNITCDVCGVKDFNHYRYKCTKCEDYDLCGRCFEQNLVSKDHQLIHPLIIIKSNIKINLPKLIDLKEIQKDLLKNNLTHYDISCNYCKKIITGIRFKCDHCFNFNSCFPCYEKSVNKKSDHIPLLAYLYQREIKVEKKDIVLKDKLGSGHFGEAYKVKYSGSDFVCKKMNFKNIDKEIYQTTDEESYHNAKLTFLNELKLYREIHCNKLIELHGFCHDDDEIYLILELMNNGTLLSQLKEKEISLRRKMDYLYQIINGLVRLHSLGIIHKDIKSDNIFIDSNLTAKLGDLGISKIKGEYEMKIVNTGITPNDTKFTNKVDIFSFGLLCEEVLLSTPKKHHKTFTTKIKRVSASKYFNEMITSCLYEDYNKRPESKNIEKYFYEFDKFFWDYIIKNKVPYYMNSKTEDKDKVFDKIYFLFIEDHPFTVKY